MQAILSQLDFFSEFPSFPLGKGAGVLTSKVKEVAKGFFGGFVLIDKAVGVCSYESFPYVVKQIGWGGATLGAAALPLLIIRLVTGSFLSSDYSASVRLLSQVEVLSTRKKDDGLKKELLSRVVCVAAGVLALSDAAMHVTGAVGKLSLYTGKVVVVTALSITGLILVGINGFLLDHALGQSWSRQVARIIAIASLAFGGNFLRTKDSLKWLWDLWLHGVATAAKLGAAAKNINRISQDITLEEVFKHSQKAGGFAIGILLNSVVGAVSPRACLAWNVKLGLKEPKVSIVQRVARRIFENHKKFLFLTGALATCYLFPDEIKAASRYTRSSLGIVYSQVKSFLSPQTELMAKMNEHLDRNNQILAALLNRLCDQNGLENQCYIV